jgi:CheY-like chemotaxis protein
VPRAVPGSASGNSRLGDPPGPRIASKSERSYLAANGLALHISEFPLSARPLKILVVDDNHDVADSLASLLQLYDYSTSVAHDGVAGLVAARAFRPDCIISDLTMPVLDGYGLARAVRADPALADIKLIAFSAHADEAHIDEIGAAGFDYYLTKGRSPQELLEVLLMLEEVKDLASQTRDLAQQNVELAGQTKELLKEVKEDIKEIKQEVKDLKEEVRDLKSEPGSGAPPAGTNEHPTNPSSH